MPREWGRFWIAIAIMVLAGAVVFGAVLRAPFNVGSIGQWASAVGTTAAIWVALRNSQKALQSQERRETLKAIEAGGAYMAAVDSVVTMAMIGMQTVHDSTDAGEPLTAYQLRRIVEIAHLEGLLGSLDRIPLHAAPNQSVVLSMTNTRSALSNTLRVVLAAAQAEPPSVVVLSNEFKLMAKTYERFQKTKRDVAKAFDADRSRVDRHA